MSLLDLIQNEDSQTLPEKYKKLSIPEMEERVRTIKDKFGSKLFIPGHHYQKDEVIQFADVTGDSLKLAQVSAKNKEAEDIVFCGVHFMAETADILTGNEQKVILPDMRAGCSMADMADINQTERGRKVMQENFGDTISAFTYEIDTVEITSLIER